MSDTVFTISVFAITALFLGVLAFAEPLGKPIIAVLSAWIAKHRRTKTTTVQTASDADAGGPPERK